MKESPALRHFQSEDHACSLSLFMSVLPGLVGCKKMNSDMIRCHITSTNDLLLFMFNDMLLKLAPTLLIWSHIFYVYYSNVSTDASQYPTFLFLVWSHSGPFQMCYNPTMYFVNLTYPRRLLGSNSLSGIVEDALGYPTTIVTASHSFWFPDTN